MTIEHDEVTGLPEISTEDQLTLLALARGAIANHLSGCDTTLPADLPAILDRPAGVFCTLYLGDSLRGCVGYIFPNKPVPNAVIEMAVAAATQDPRFPPLLQHDLSRTTIKLSILSPLFKITPEQVEVGRHGLLLEYKHIRAILLPEVAGAHNWTVDEYLSHLCQKAGLPSSLLPHARLFAFTAMTFSDPDRRSVRTHKSDLE